MTDNITISLWYTSRKGSLCQQVLIPLFSPNFLFLWQVEDLERYYKRTNIVAESSDDFAPDKEHNEDHFRDHLRDYRKDIGATKGEKVISHRRYRVWVEAEDQQ